MQLITDASTALHPELKKKKQKNKKTKLSWNFKISKTWLFFIHVLPKLHHYLKSMVGMGLQN